MTLKKQKMLIIGLTGSIGMGKSTVAGLLADMGLPIYNADHAVHSLLKKGGAAVPRVAKLFPHSLKRGAIDRAALGTAIFNQPDQLKKLEKILHPMIRRVERDFLRRARRDKARAAILEIPLLFETGGESRCDVTLCVTAPRAVQRARVMARPGMTAEKFRAIQARQMPDPEKRRRADFIVPTGGTVAATEKHLRRILKSLLS